MITDTIYNENCLKTMARMTEPVIDLTVTSPPYDNLRDYTGYSFPFEDIAKELYRVTKPGGVVVWIVADATIKGSETGTSFRQALYFKEIGFQLFDTMIYAKSPRGACGNSKTYWSAFEYMFILSKGNPKTINLIKDRKNKEARNGDNGTKRLRDGTRLKIKRSGYKNVGRRTNIWEYSVGKGHSTKDTIAFDHPAIFPEKLAEDHILTWSNKSDLIYDPFMGSGTVAKLCILKNRHYIGSEISKEYYILANKRVSVFSSASQHFSF